MTYQPPTRTSFILGWQLKDTKIISCYVDNAGQVARITTFMKDIGTGNMAKIEDRLSSKIDSIFPKDLHGSNDGKALIFEKGQNTC
jgi:hypothetical protein